MQLGCLISRIRIGFPFIKLLTRWISMQLVALLNGMPNDTAMAACGMVLARSSLFDRSVLRN
jgi:hypothetical protein